MLGRRDENGPRVICYFGVPAPVATLRALRSLTQARICNMYGATKAVGCFFNDVTDTEIENGLIGIGRPALGNSATLRGTNGTRGELVIDGPSVMLGYVGEARHVGPYRTGDVAALLPDGSFRLIGRDDLQRNLRGYRLHLGEIESFVATVPGVSSAVAEVLEGVDGPVLSLLVEASDATLTPLDVRRACASGLPLSMRPGTIRFADSLPRLRNGKLDRSAAREILLNYG